MLKVLNLRNARNEKTILSGEAIYVGRPSIYGNPFHIGKDGTREEVIEKHRNYVCDNPVLVARIKRELRGRDLSCWCTPLPCHADTLLEIANQKES